MTTISTNVLSSSVHMGYVSETKSIESSIIVNGSAKEVWEVLTSLEKWQEWNPFIKKSEGKVVVGEKIRNEMDNDGKTFVFKPKVVEVEENRVFAWTGHLFIPGLFDGTHKFELVELRERKVKLIQSESFKGILSGMILKKIGDETAKNFDAMNRALKERIEQK